MTNKEILQADMLDILFEHRNKLYGAYALRKTYTHRLGLALGAALSIVLLFILMSFLKKGNGTNGPFNNDSAVILTDVTIPKEEVKEPEIPKEQPKPKAQSDYQPLVVVPDKEADPQIVENNDLINTDISNQNVEGEKPDNSAKPVAASTGAGTVPVKEPEVVKPDLPTRNASFPGGTAAWLDFLRKFLQSPEDIEPGQRIEVLVRFWIGIDGVISNPEIIKSGGKSFDKEVLRVLKKMPRWDPAIQHGNYIAVTYTQPVIFIGVEE
jgi:periplasmic protein TonB